MNDLLIVAGCCGVFGLLWGWLAGRASGIEEERARQIDALLQKPRAGI
jgi:hypothetical protein